MAWFAGRRRDPAPINNLMTNPKYVGRFWQFFAALVSQNFLERRAFF
jgi:hypothetical protein